MKPRHYALVSHFASVTLTSIYGLNLDILKMYLRTENEASSSMLSKVRIRTGQTDRRDRGHYHSCIRVW